MVSHEPELSGTADVDVDQHSQATSIDVPHDRDVEKQQAAVNEAGLDSIQDDAAADLDSPLKQVKSADFQYPPMKKAIVIMLSIYLCVFLVALDRTIIGTAIPKITDEFDSFDDVGWYGSAYMITTAGEWGHMIGRQRLLC